MASSGVSDRGSASVAEQAVGADSVTVTGSTDPISVRGAITCTGCRYGERPTNWPGSRPGFSNSTSRVRPDKLRVERPPLPGDDRLQACSRSAFTSRGTCRRHLGRRRARARRILERIGAGKTDLLDERQRRAEILFGLAGKADDEIGGERDVGPRGAQARDHREIVLPRVPAVHRRENAVGARLHRQMQYGISAARSRCAAIRSSSMSRGWLVV